MCIRDSGCGGCGGGEYIDVRDAIRLKFGRASATPPLDQPAGQQAGRPGGTRQLFCRNEITCQQHVAPARLRTLQWPASPADDTIWWKDVNVPFITHPSTAFWAARLFVSCIAEKLRLTCNCWPHYRVCVCVCVCVCQRLTRYCSNTVSSICCKFVFTTVCSKIHSRSSHTTYLGYFTVVCWQNKEKRCIVCGWVLWCILHAIYVVFSFGLYLFVCTTLRGTCIQ